MTLSERIHAERESKRAEQARRQATRRPAMGLSPAYCLQRYHLALARANSTSTDERDLDVLITGPLAQLERLRTGNLDDIGYVEIAEACAAAAELANEMWLLGTDDTKSAMEAIKADLLACGGALHALAERGRYIAKADELRTLHVGLDLYEQLIKVADRGAVSRALEIAAGNIRQALRVAA